MDTETARRIFQQVAVAEAKVNLKNEVAEQAAVMAEGIIKSNLQADDQVALVEGYLAKVGGAA